MLIKLREAKAIQDNEAGKARAGDLTKSLERQTELTRLGVQYGADSAELRAAEARQAREVLAAELERAGIAKGTPEWNEAMAAQARKVFADRDAADKARADGAGGLLSVEPIVMTSELVVQMQRLTLSPLPPEITEIIRGHDVRFAPLEIHRWLLDPVTGLPIDDPDRRFRGWIDTIEILTPEEGGEARCDVTAASDARSGTRGLTSKKSDASQRLRLISDGRPDRFARYSDLRKTKVTWR